MPYLSISSYVTKYRLFYEAFMLLVKCLVTHIGERFFTDLTAPEVGTSVYLSQTHLRTPLQVPAWVRKFSLGSTGDEISSLIIIQSLFVQQKFEY